MRVSKVFPTLWSMLAASSVDPPSFEFRTYVPSANTPAALTYRVQRSNVWLLLHNNQLWQTEQNYCNGVAKQQQVLTSGISCQSRLYSLSWAESRTPHQRAGSYFLHSLPKQMANHCLRRGLGSSSWDRQREMTLFFRQTSWQCVCVCVCGVCRCGVVCVCVRVCVWCVDCTD